MQNKKTLFIMVGAPGSGKSTFAAAHASRGDSAIISRDKIRFSMVGEDEEYFSKENAVFKEFTNQISNALNSPWIQEVWADATHMTTTARTKLLVNIKIPLEDIHICPIVVRPDLDTCLRQNDMREGRAVVPHTAIKKMLQSYQDPAKDGIKYKQIYYTGGNINAENLRNE